MSHAKVYEKNAKVYEKTNAKVYEKTITVAKGPKLYPSKFLIVYFALFFISTKSVLNLIFKQINLFAPIVYDLFSHRLILCRRPLTLPTLHLNLRK